MVTIAKRLYDTAAIMNILGCLIQKPELLSEVDKYKLTKEDFDEKFTKAIFIAIDNLYKNGAERVGPADVDAYLQQNPGAHKTFKENQGYEYLDDAEQIAKVENFPYYYLRVKKFSALRDLEDKGYSVKKIYDDAIVTPEKIKKMTEEFDRMSLKDIFDVVLQDYSKLEADYVGKMSGSRGIISEGMRDLKKQLERTPEVGFPLQGEYLNTILRGARKTKFYLRSGSTGSGKTRLMLGDACNIAFPVRYSKKTKNWIREGFKEKVLFITTEIDSEELQTMVWAYLADVNEEKILYNSYENDEEERVQKAIEVAEEYQDNFHWEHIPDPTIEGITAAVRNQVRNHGITHVFYDYIFSSPSLMREFDGQNLREDVVLMMLSTKLKDLANELDVFIESGSQLNRGWESSTNGNIRSQNLLRGSTAIADKIDAGYITLPAQQEELTMLSKLIESKGGKKPTHVTDIYKLRRGRYKNVRVWSSVDLGTCRMEDLFVTDALGNEVAIPILKYHFEDWNDF